MDPRLLEPRVTSHPYVKNRLMVIDWASLSYHMMFSMKTTSAKKMLGLMSADDELLRWKNSMFQKILDYITLFNPRRIIFALEGKRAWRKKFVKEYYEKHADVFFDKTAYYVCSDNYAYSVRKRPSEDGGEVSYVVDPIPMKNRGFLTEDGIGHRKLGELPKEKQDMLWGISTESGKPILPSYKGHRKSSNWPFFVDKHFWMGYKDEFARSIAPAFRASAIGLDVAEGDDIVYASVQKYAPQCDDAIIVTRDSDMSQISLPNLKIFNHVTETFTVCQYPEEFLDAKVLSGDTSDNISGMSFVDEKTGKLKPGKSTQIGETTALTLMSNCPAIYATAKENGWDEQYMRNRTLIDLSMVPADVKRQIDVAVSVSEPETADETVLAENGITENRLSSMRQLRSFGFYLLNSKTAVDSNPDMFQADVYRKEAPKMEEAALEQNIAIFDSVNMFAGPGVSFV